MLDLHPLTTLAMFLRRACMSFADFADMPSRPFPVNTFQVTTQIDCAAVHRGSFRVSHSTHHKPTILLSSYAGVAIGDITQRLGRGV